MKTVGDEDGEFVFVSVCECISDGSFFMRNRKSIMEMFFHDICYRRKKKHKTIYKENFFSSSVSPVFCTWWFSGRKIDREISEVVISYPCLLLCVGRLASSTL